MKTDISPAVRPRLRVMSGKEIAFGPGKAELLEALAQTGSIRGASTYLGMSYMRAWTLVRTMNQCFREPLVLSERGGTRGGGGARLTAAGRQVLALYRRMESKSVAVIQPDWKQLKKLLKN